MQSQHPFKRSQILGDLCKDGYKDPFETALWGFPLSLGLIR